tara:strand:- start:1911 stop:3530 length:1620 start_codon:yes stop_codon:yes gene_type:complete
MPTNNSSNASNAQYNLLVGTGSSYTSLAPGATVGTPLCSGGVSANPVYDTTPTVSSITISNVPVSGTDGANKDYVDLTTGGFNYKNTTYASTTANLNATYANGAAGVGATLTNAGVQAAFSTDGVSPPINSRILVQFQTAAADNGIYDLTTVGTGASNWVLTRSTDYDTAAEIQQGDIVPVANGTLYHDTLWLQTDVVVTVGTDPINFNQFGGTAISTVQYNALVGGVSNSIVSVAPSSTAGIPFVSTGSSTDPAFTTAVVAGGGTGATSFADVNSVLLTGATGTSALGSLTSGTSGYVLTSQGPGVAPTWLANSAGALSINIQTFTSSGTYTPTAGMVYCIVECVGGGGGGAGANSTSEPPLAVGGGGAGGDYSRSVFSASAIGASKAVVIGAGGAGGVGYTFGNAGGATTFGSTLAAAAGGAGGQYGTTFGTLFSTAGGGAPSATGTSIGTVIVQGGYGGNGYAQMTIMLGIPGVGGSSVLGSGSRFYMEGNAGTTGFDGYLYGGGGGGGYCWTGVATVNGGAGKAGVVIVTEYIMT